MNRPADCRHKGKRAVNIRIEIEASALEISVRSSAEDFEEHFTDEAEAVAHLRDLKAGYEGEGHKVEIRKIERPDALPLSLI